ncbi:uncharacterized protein LOC135167385 isoform X1 [Diachasmimorpha longicaudata]|uniref:uncharacterized protein LOC135167385 isoform X1 n=1 Tax=Diachasmimorpha longicaudata TaxID=58733 RepID=UPI0030B90AEC
MFQLNDKCKGYTNSQILETSSNDEKNAITIINLGTAQTLTCEENKENHSMNPLNLKPSQLINSDSNDIKIANKKLNEINSILSTRMNQSSWITIILSLTRFMLLSSPPAVVNNIATVSNLSDDSTPTWLTQDQNRSYP